MKRPFERLLLATEHTEFDTGAERVGIALAARCGLPLATVMPLASNPEYESVAPQLVARIEAEAREKIARLAETGEAAGVDMQIRVRRGEELWQEIVAAAHESAADLLITRRRGKRSFLAELLVGDMVSKVAAHAPCSVLMVPRTATMWRHGVIAAIDNSATAERVIAVAIAVTAQCGLPLTFVHVDDGSGAQAPALLLAGAIERAQAAGIGARGEIGLGKVHEAVTTAQKSCGADLLILGLRSDEAIEPYGMGANARKLIAVAETPVLVVKP